LLHSVEENFVPQFQAQQAIYELIKVRCTGSLLDKKPAGKCCVLTKEKLDNIGGRLEHTTEISEMPCTKDQLLKTTSSHSYKAA
jgi:hypothetical protein